MNKLWRAIKQGIEEFKSTQWRKEDGVPTAFFPSEVGASWEYDIKLSGTPLFYREVAWPGKGKGLGVSARGTYQNSALNQQFELGIRIALVAPDQGPLKYPAGVELDIYKDGLGVYANHQNVFWASKDSDHLSVVEIITYLPTNPNHPAGNSQFGPKEGAGGGAAARQIFFSDAPGVARAIEFGVESYESLRFEGVDRSRSDDPRLHFVRVVKKSRDSRNDDGFLEHLWYARSIGLVELRQTVNGIETMCWTLRRFQPPESIAKRKTESLWGAFRITD